MIHAATPSGSGCRRRLGCGRRWRGGIDANPSCRPKDVANRRLQVAHMTTAQAVGGKRVLRGDRDRVALDRPLDLGPEPQVEAILAHPMTQGFLDLSSDFLATWSIRRVHTGSATLLDNLFAGRNE